MIQKPTTRISVDVQPLIFVETPIGTLRISDVGSGWESGGENASKHKRLAAQVIEEVRSALGGLDWDDSCLDSTINELFGIEITDEEYSIEVETTIRTPWGVIKFVGKDDVVTADLNLEESTIEERKEVFSQIWALPQCQWGHEVAALLYLPESIVDELG